MQVSLAQIITSIISLTGLTVIILLVSVRDFKNKIIQRFILFSFLVLIYVLLTFLDDFQSSLYVSLWMIRSEVFFANFIPTAFYSFAVVFTGYKYQKKWASYLIYLTIIPMSVIAYLPSTVKSVIRGQFGVNVDKTGPLYYVTLIYFLVVLTYSFIILFRNSKVSDRVTKLQTSLISFGLGVTVAINLVVVFLFPFFGLTDIGNLIGTPSIIILVAGIGYAVLVQHMFDIRTVIIRSIGFFVIIGITAGLFVAAILGLGALAIPGLILKPNEYIFIISASVVAGMIFKPLTDNLQSRFNKAFSSTTYDPKTVLNKIANLLATTIKVDDLFIGIEKIFVEYLGIRRVDGVIYNKDEIIYRTTDVTSYPSPEEFTQLGDENINIDETIDQDKLAILRKYNINFYIVMHAQGSKVGYLLLGPKNNGLSFNATDIKTVLTIADQLSVALRNIISFVEIQNFNKTLQQKVEKATDKLRDTNAKLEDANSTKDDFISMASHQLTTPIVSIEGYLSMANRGYLGEINPKLSKSLLAAEDQARVMKGIISDLLNVSRMASGKFVLELVETDLGEIAKREVELSEPLANEQGTVLKYNEPKDKLHKIVCDEQKIRQVIVNFITNALHYAPKGQVDVYAQNATNGIELRVVDDGIGVPEDQKSKLFQKFFRASNAAKERPSGNGIGLYLAKKVIEEHGGKIIFQSTENKGSTFGFFLPSQPVNSQLPAKPSDSAE